MDSDGKHQVESYGQYQSLAAFTYSMVQMQWVVLIETEEKAASYDTDISPPTQPAMG